MRIKVYGSLSITRAEVRAILPRAEFVGPIQREDILADVRRGVDVVAVVDGRFHQAHAVAPAEICDAMRAGLRVYGASSMGAMRAAELWEHGMIGHGLIFEHIRATPYFRDDFLGQTFDARGGAGASVPYVDFFFNCRALAERGAISKDDSRRILEAYAELPYPLRNRRELARVLASKPRGRSLLPLAQRAFSLGSQKKRDALGLLRRIRADLSGIARANERILRSLRRRPLV